MFGALLTGGFNRCRHLKETSSSGSRGENRRCPRTKPTQNKPADANPGPQVEQQSEATLVGSAIGNGELTATSKGMGVIRSAFSLMAGTLFGVYLAQNYNVPNIGKLLNSGLVIAQHIEENYRKPSATTNSNDDAVDVSK
ncbi:hypothetical protein Gotur_011979 [Gossypium turneri]